MIFATMTALIAAAGGDGAEKKTAVAHLLFNFLGVLFFTSSLLRYGRILNILTPDPASVLALGHSIRKVVMVVELFLLLDCFTKSIGLLFPEREIVS